MGGGGGGLCRVEGAQSKRLCTLRTFPGRVVCFAQCRQEAGKEVP